MCCWGYLRAKLEDVYSPGIRCSHVIKIFSWTRSTKFQWCRNMHCPGPRKMVPQTIRCLGSSHQIMHLFVFYGVLSHERGMMKAIQWWAKQGQQADSQGMEFGKDLSELQVCPLWIRTATDQDSKMQKHSRIGLEDCPLNAEHDLGWIKVQHVSDLFETVPFSGAAEEVFSQSFERRPVAKMFPRRPVVDLRKCSATRIEEVYEHWNSVTKLHNIDYWTRIWISQVMKALRPLLHVGQHRIPWSSFNTRCNTIEMTYMMPLNDTCRPSFQLRPLQQAIKNGACAELRYM